MFVDYELSRVSNVNMMFRETMFFWLLLYGTTVSVPTKELKNVINEGELALNDDAFIQHIVPGLTFEKLETHRDEDFAKPFQNNGYYELLKDYIDKGYTMKGLTFNIYDDKMREAAVALFRLLQDLFKTNKEDYKTAVSWARHNINRDMVEYAEIMQSLYTDKFDHVERPPPFISKPNHFVNAETIRKASVLKINNGNFNRQDAKVNQFFRTDDIISINTNYSAWNILKNGCDKRLNYFREDVGLNSYYYGIHMLYPFWMMNKEQDDINPRHAEQYYMAHRQLLARYKLELGHLNWDNIFPNKDCQIDYQSYLIHENGLPFPVRPAFILAEDLTNAQLKSKNIAIQELMSRGIILLENGTMIKMTEDNHVDLLSKLVRANYDGLKTANNFRSLFGYGGKGLPNDMYNPAPSTSHFSETSLRDPLYWYLMTALLKYFEQYEENLPPFDLSQYETNDYEIADQSFTKITTRFDYYQFKINRAFQNDDYDHTKSQMIFTARQRRLQHYPFTLKFIVESKVNKDVVVRLFLSSKRPKNNYWGNFTSYFELDKYIYNLEEGTNIISWSPENSQRFSSDQMFNLEKVASQVQVKNEYSIFKFPESLLIPRGTIEGLHLTLFIMITPADEIVTDDTVDNNLYSILTKEADNKPLGFPFHRPAKNYNEASNNYRFYEITVFHESMPVDRSGQFSPHLY